MSHQMLESKVQKDHMDLVKAQGGLSLKFTSPGRRNVPDCIDLYGATIATATLYNLLSERGVSLTTYELNLITRKVLESAIQFTECKQPGKKPTAAQEREHARLRVMGFKVNVVDGV